MTPPVGKSFQAGLRTSLGTSKNRRSQGLRTGGCSSKLLGFSSPWLLVSASKNKGLPFFFKPFKLLVSAKRVMTRKQSSFQGRIGCCAGLFKESNNLKWAPSLQEYLSDLWSSTAVLTITATEQLPKQSLSERPESKVAGSCHFLPCFPICL